VMTRGFAGMAGSPSTRRQAPVSVIPAQTETQR
jgi:hypothetical protein